MDGIGLHVADLAEAQRASGSYTPQIITAPSPAYRQRLMATGVPTTLLARPVRADQVLRQLVGRHLAGGGVDLVHLHGYRATHLYPLLRLLRPARWRVPTLATCHGLLSDSVRRRMRAGAEVQVYGRLNAVITSSGELQLRVTSRHPRLPVRYVPNGVALGPPASPAARRALRARLALPADAPVIASIGRLAKEKRLDLFLAAGEQLIRRHPSVHLLVVGDGPLRSWLEKSAQSRQLRHRVRFTGLIQDVPEICAGLTVMLHCSDTEGTPRAVLHAMAAGVPVVATEVGGLPQMIRSSHDGLLVPPGRADQVAEAAATLLGNQRLRQQIGERARARARAEFSLELMRQRVEQVYDGVLSGARRGPGHD